MINECTIIFIDNEEDILNGRHITALAKTIPSASNLEALIQLAKRYCYKAPEVLEIELAGYEALGGLLAYFVPTLHNTQEESKKSGRARELLLRRDVIITESSLYERILRVTDYVSGMTDRHALNTYRRLRGISIPGTH